MPLSPAYAIALLGLCIATITDLKKREVPDLVSYGMILFGIAFNLLLAYTQKDWWILGFSAIGLVVGAAMGLAMLYMGQWGGGDAKILAGIGALVGIAEPWGFFTLFLVNSVLAGALYGIGYSYVLAIKHWKRFFIGFKAALLEKHVALAQRFYLAFAALLVVSVFFLPSAFTLPFLVLAMLCSILFYSWIIAKVVQQTVLIKRYPVSRLTEGDWVLETVKSKNRVLYRPKNIGIEMKDIALLKKYKIRFVQVKEGIPFLPSFLIAFVLSLLGNWLHVLF